MTTEVVSGAEIGRRLGVSREAVRQWARRAGFPAPLGRVGRSVIWDWQAVEAWWNARPERRASARRATGKGRARG